MAEVDIEPRTFALVSRPPRCLWYALVFSRCGFNISFGARDKRGGVVVENRSGVRGDGRVTQMYLYRVVQGTLSFTQYWRSLRGVVVKPLVL